MPKKYVKQPVGFERVDDGPLSPDQVFDTLELAQLYAASNPTAYDGQVLGVKGHGIYFIKNKELVICYEDLNPEIKKINDSIGELARAQNSQADTSSGGEIEVNPFQPYAPIPYVIKNKVDETDPEEFIGYIMMGPSEKGRQQMFNVIKVAVKWPGAVRIGIIKGTLGNAEGESTGCFAAPENRTIQGWLKKWLVCQMAVYVGEKTYYVEDTVLGPDEWIFIDSRSGGSGACYNGLTTPFVLDTNLVSNKSLPAGFAHSGAIHTDAMDSYVNGEVFKTRNFLTQAANFAYNGSSPVRGARGAEQRGWYDWNSKNTNEILATNKKFSLGDLNIGLYRKGDQGDYASEPLIEASNATWNSVANVAYFAKGQGDLVGLELWGLEFIVSKIGRFAIRVWDFGEDADVDTFTGTATLVREFLGYARCVGKMTYHLPEIIVLKKGQVLTLGGPLAQSEAEEAANVQYAQFSFCSHIDFTNLGYLAETREDIVVPLNSFGKNACGIRRISTTTKAVADQPVNYYMNINILARKFVAGPLEDLYLTIQGDSISTYAGMITKKNDFPAGNVAGDNAAYYPNAMHGQVNNVDATWWMILARKNRMLLLRNDAWSGSKCSGTDGTAAQGSTAAAAYARCLQCQQTTAPITATPVTFPYYSRPDVILTNIGTNDLSGGVQLGTMEENLTGLTATKTISTLLQAFSVMVARHLYLYPSALRVYFIIPRGKFADYINATSNVSMADFVDGATKICKRYGAHFVPLEQFALLSTMQNSKVWWGLYGMSRDGHQILPGAGNPHMSLGDSKLDYLHPGYSGHEYIAQQLTKYLKSII